ncbi:MAG: tetratricopeptide repeat protein [Pedosphaera sp.]|nr:tetratricopeptide repeat protein [Pedosphaera sp.]
MKNSAKLRVVLSLFGVAFLLGLALRTDSRFVNPARKYVPHPKGTLTFNKDIAPIVFKQCASCHRPGQSAPFNLMSYADVKKRAQQIGEVTAKGVMPPWLPEPGYGDFADARLLSGQEIGAIAQWIREGATEGEAKELPELPKWVEGWRLGEPDLMVKMGEPYTLKAEGKDVYRNFVIPIPLEASRYVKAVEFQPGNSKIVHHAFIRFDRTPESRQLDEKDSEPGFGGIHTPENAFSPDGYFLSWQPGKVPSRGIEGLAWRLEKGSDLVLQMHMQPAGKPEMIQPAIAFHFAEKPPTNTPFKIGLSSYAIDIPAGKKDYIIQDSYLLPVDVQILGILPHAHYLGKELRGYATLPDGTKKWLLLIKRWDFNWQGDYHYINPVFLPRGTRLTMEFSYDNSDANERNPSRPPKRVRYGLQSTDEMGELWFQVLPRHTNDLKTLTASYQYKIVEDVMAYNNYLLQQDRNDFKAHNKIAKALLTLGKTAEALQHLHTAAAIVITDPETHYLLGIIYRQQNKLLAAKGEFENVLRLDPNHYKAHGNLGLVLLGHGDLAQAEVHFKQALRLNPDDMVAKESLDDIAKAKAGSGKQP